MKLFRLATVLVLLSFAGPAFADGDGSGDEDEPIEKKEEEAVKDEPAATLDAGLTGNIQAVSLAVEDGCSKQNLATKIYCYPVEIMVKYLPCTYGKNTPQYRLCKDQPIPSKASGSTKSFGPHFQLNPEFAPFHIDSTGLREHFLPYLDKAKPGKTVHTWDKDHKLVMRLKRTDKQNIIYVTEIINAKGKVVGRPVFYFKGSKLFVNDLKRKPK